jgi:hypothetical protein
LSSSPYNLKGILIFEVQAKRKVIGSAFSQRPAIESKESMTAAFSKMAPIWPSSKWKQILRNWTEKLPQQVFHHEKPLNAGTL